MAMNIIACISRYLEVGGTEHRNSTEISSRELKSRRWLTENVDGEPNQQPGTEHIDDDAQGMCKALQCPVLGMGASPCMTPPH